MRPWYEAKKARCEDDARRAVVAVMRKLAVALYHIGVDNQEFKPRGCDHVSATVFAGIPMIFSHHLA